MTSHGFLLLLGRAWGWARGGGNEGEQMGFASGQGLADFHPPAPVSPWPCCIPACSEVSMSVGDAGVTWAGQRGGP